MQANHKANCCLPSHSTELSRTASIMSRSCQCVNAEEAR